jgi:peptidoglycan/LPS O-acetylase OafA/YrhL
MSAAVALRTQDASATTGGPASRQVSGPHAKRVLDHITPLDGLRGIAVVLVLVFHFSWTFPDGSVLASALKRVFWVGWVGVDLFFVLSGYLITRGLVAPSDQAVGTRLRKFWARRVLRIFPLYYIVLIIGSGVCLLASAPIPTLPYWFYFQNYALAFDPYVLRWTAHFWSLAIEEQFYFLWPLLALRAPRRVLVPATVALAVFCITVRGGMGIHMHMLEHAGQHEAAEQVAKIAYRATPTHMDGLLFGALLAILGADPASRLAVAWKRARPFALGATTLVLLGLFVVTHGFNDYDGRVIAVGYATLALFFASVVSIAVDGSLAPAWGTILDSRPLRACGRVSYGMYILHWPLVVFTIPLLTRLQAEAGPVEGVALGVGAILVGIAVTYTIAEVSFRFVETPFLRLKARFHE